MKVKIQVACNVCDTKFAIVVRKPSLATPVRTNVKCTLCESSNLYKIEHANARGLRNWNQLGVTPIGFKPSKFYLEQLALAEQEEAKAKENENVESAPLHPDSSDSTDAGISESRTMPERAGPIPQDGTTTE